jgi:hypothetical protein
MLLNFNSSVVPLARFGYRQIYLWETAMLRCNNTHRESECWKNFRLDKTDDPRWIKPVLSAGSENQPAMGTSK